jgi:segregation and condensation protein A
VSEIAAEPVTCGSDGARSGAPHFLLDGFEGPLDLLLDLARAQKVDLARISIVSLVDQFLAVVGGVRLELAADWLVMAAWLTWLKSRLLLPPEDAGAQEGEEAAGMLAERLAELETMRAAAGWLSRRRQLGLDVFARGTPEDLVSVDSYRLAADLPGLVRAYLAALRRAGGAARYRPRPVEVWTVQDALARLRAMLRCGAEWQLLEAFLPEPRPGADAALQRRAAVASTLLAGLELARSGAVRLRQEAQFGPILLRAADAAP